MIKPVPLILLLLLTGCTKSFELPETQPDNTVLVVEGNIQTGGSGENTFTLGRVKALFAFDDIPEENALVEIKQENGPRWKVPHQGKGVYKSQLQLPTDKPLALQITTADGKIYETPYQQAVITPEIDSITFKQEQTGDVKLFVHSHDDQNKTKNYKWTFTETWERRAWFQGLYEFKNGNIIPRAPDDQIYTCWNTAEAPSFIIGNTNDLSADVISYQPLGTIIRPSEKLFIRYSILVKQIGLSQEAYNYWEILKKNTELTGTLFDPQPSRMPTNITCTNDKSKEAIGYISVGNVTEKRIFIMNSEVNLWPSRNESAACDAFEFSKFQAERFLSQNPIYLPAYFITAGGGFGVALRQCVDCRLTGGVNIKPDFW
jgi:Domain of unknown function (DUF4249)